MDYMDFLNVVFRWFHIIAGTLFCGIELVVQSRICSVRLDNGRRNTEKNIAGAYSKSPLLVQVVSNLHRHFRRAIVDSDILCRRAYD